MNAATYDDNMLYRLAETLAGGGQHCTATALRKLAQEGYTTLEEVDGTSDWVLLSIRGIGVGRLGEVRRLTRSDWQPPSPQAIQAAAWFLSAALLALRYWSPETLVALIRGSTLATTAGDWVEKQLALDVFSQAVRKALYYCEAEELVQALWQAGNCRAERTPPAESSSGLDVQQDAVSMRSVEATAPSPPTGPSDGNGAVGDSDRFAHPRHKRLEIVRHYWSAREKREIGNKEAWARSHFNISARTLRRYEREFLEAYGHSTG